MVLNKDLNNIQKKKFMATNVTKIGQHLLDGKDTGYIIKVVPGMVWLLSINFKLTSSLSKSRSYR